MVRDLSRALAATSWPPENECGVSRATCRRRGSAKPISLCQLAHRLCATRLVVRCALQHAFNAEVVVAPSFLHAHALEEGLGGAGRRAVFLGAQDVYAGSGSAHTGEVRRSAASCVAQPSPDGGFITP